MGLKGLLFLQANNQKYRLYSRYHNPQLEFFQVIVWLYLLSILFVKILLLCMVCIQEWFEIKDIGYRIVESTGEKKSTSYLMQTIGMAIQRGNSSCIWETVVDSRKLDEIYYL